MYRRFLSSIPVFIGVSVIIFLLISYAGDPLSKYKNNPRVSKEDISRLRRNMGLDKPVHVRYVTWVSDFAKGDLGQSISKKQPVIDLIKARIPATALLMVTSFAISSIIAIFIGTISAIKRNKPLDHIITGVSFLGYSIPTFWLGLMLQLYLGYQLWQATGVKVFYVSGIQSIGGGGGFVDLLQHMALPVIALSVAQVAQWSRYQRSSMIEVLDAPYLKTARAKGLNERQVIFRHALKNSLIPVATIMAMDMAYMFNGAVIIESVFSWPGMGSLFYEAVLKHDYPLVMGIMMISAFLVILFNLLSDLLNAYLDPRIRYE